MPFSSVRSKATHHTKSLSSSVIKRYIERKLLFVDKFSFLYNSSISSKEKDDSVEDQGVVEPKFPLKKYDYVEGRNYDKSKKPNEQFLPCDDEEIERLQVNHLLFK